MLWTQEGRGTLQLTIVGIIKISSGKNVQIGLDFSWGQFDPSVAAKG